MTSKLAALTRHRCFISYHHDDESEVRNFVDFFDHGQNVLITRGIGAGMAGDIVNSNDSTYIMRRVRESYLSGSTVTIVLIGRCTWARKYVDWEIASSLRNNPTSAASGLLGITLPSVSGAVKRLPPRLDDNVAGDRGYARWWQYPTDEGQLSAMIEIAYQAREDVTLAPDNSRDLFGYNRSC